MDVVTDVSTCRPPEAGSAVTIGAYDGVHLGHRALLARLRARAGTQGLETVVVTFDRHPATVVRPDSAPLLLCDLGQKLELLASTGVDRVLVLPFDEERAREPAREFIDEVLVRALGTRVVVVGEDFHFGHGRQGDVAMLREVGAQAGFAVDGVSLETASVAGAPGPISSTRIRALVASGEVAQAAVLLGRPHQLRGMVGHGDGRGGPQLGYPTANVDIPPGMAVPGEGIYAGYYERPGGSHWPAAVSIGTRPTYYGSRGPVLVEAHLLDFSGDLYGEAARVSFVERLRGNQVFDTTDALVSQMDQDIAATRKLLADR
ncbi:MAG: bifunctional riboflavin kinase/FAD synthetase [Actinomycetota bacterium]|nr:bifunctional riboflavin kinase/FAD synthetase [Actinomycetota bacterium]